MFHIPLFFPDGKSVKTNAHVTEAAGFVFENIAKRGFYFFLRMGGLRNLDR